MGNVRRIYSSCHSKHTMWRATSTSEVSKNLYTSSRAHLQVIHRIRRIDRHNEHIIRGPTATRRVDKTAEETAVALAGAVEGALRDVVAAGVEVEHQGVAFGGGDAARGEGVLVVFADVDVDCFGGCEARAG
jgi:hypothetical protein